MTDRARTVDRRYFMRGLLAAAAVVSGCGGGGGGDDRDATQPDDAGGDPAPSPGDTSAPPASNSKSAKRGIAYDLQDARDFAALSPGVSWWYNWSDRPSPAAPANAATAHGMDFYPMLWNDRFDWHVWLGIGVILASGIAATFYNTRSTARGAVLEKTDPIASET